MELKKEQKKLCKGNMENIEDIKESLRSVISFYRDEYYVFCSEERRNYYDDLLAKIENSNDLAELEMYERLVDDWLDY